MDIKIQLFKGVEVLHYLDAIIHLRVTVFREYPYLYGGDPEAEEGYVKTFARSKRSLFVLAKNHEEVIGCLTSIPAIDVLTESWATALRKLSVDSMIYLGDMLLLKEYRNQKIGSKMYDLFEKTVRKDETYSKIAFQEIVRPKDDPKRPTTYRSLDPFWNKRSYIKHPEMTQQISYLEIGDSAPVEHTFVFWIKELT